MTSRAGWEPKDNFVHWTLGECAFEMVKHDALNEVAVSELNLPGYSRAAELTVDEL